MLSLGLFSTRSKFYGFFVFASGIVLYLNSIEKIRLNLKTGSAFLIILLAVCFVAKNKQRLIKNAPFRLLFAQRKGVAFRFAYT